MRLPKLCWRAAFASPKPQQPRTNTNWHQWFSRQLVDKVIVLVLNAKAPERREDASGHRKMGKCGPELVSVASVWGSPCICGTCYASLTGERRTTMSDN